MENEEELDPVQAFQIRILLIHQYRRILLKDPNLPFELLPTDWLSLIARNLSTNLYQAVFAAGDEFFWRLPGPRKVLCHLRIHNFINVLVA